MMGTLFTVLLIILAAALIVNVLFQRLRIPTVIGYLIVGIILGPSLFSLLEDQTRIRDIAEFGVVFLLFTIGLEFSLARMIAMRRTVLGFGGLQILITLMVTALVAVAIGLSINTAIVIGSVVAMSSTAIVMKQLSTQFEVQTTHGNNALGILLMQDLAVIPLLILIPNLTATGDNVLWTHLIIATLKGGLAIVMIIFLGRFVLRPLFYRIAKTNSFELFTLATLLVALSCAWFTDELGLSLALGAFLAGMMLGETEFRHQISVEIRPFRDVLLGLFFITIGTQLKLQTIPETWVWIVLLLSALIVFKLILIAILAWAFGNNRADALRTGLVLAQGGEFGFAILIVAMQYQVLPAAYAQVILTALLLSMLIAPVLISFNKQIMLMIFRQSFHQNQQETQTDIQTLTQEMRDHAIICGYGRVGQNVTELLKQEKMQYIALDLNVDRVAQAKLVGDVIAFGDVTHPEILTAAAIEKAKVLCVCFNQRLPSMQVITHAKKLNPTIKILTRAYDDTDLEQLRQHGVTNVVPEVLEFSLIMGSHLLTLMGLSAAQVYKRIENSRKDRYQVLREIFPAQSGNEAIQAAVGKERLQVVVLPDDADACGKSIKDIGLDKAKIQIVSVRRQDESRANPRGNTKLKAGDVVVLFASPENLAHAERLLLEGKR